MQEVFSSKSCRKSLNRFWKNYLHSSTSKNLHHNKENVGIFLKHTN